MGSVVDRHAHNLILLGNTMIGRMRREIREMDAFPEQMEVLARVVIAIDRLKEALHDFDVEFKRHRKKDSVLMVRRADHSALAAGFTSALRQLEEAQVPSQSGEKGGQEGAGDRSHELGYRGGPFKVPDVMLHMSLFRKTGRLILKSPSEDFEIHLLDGDVVHAESSNTPPGLRLGEILIAQGSVTEKALEEFLEKHEGDPERLGRALKNEELVSEEDLARALTWQFQQLFSRCFRLKEVSITFQEVDPPEQEPEVRLNVVALLMEGVSA